METLSGIELAFCAIAVTTAFAVRTGAGFGASTVAIPLLAFSIPLPVAVPVVSMLIVWNSVGLIVRGWDRIAWRAVWPTLPFSLVGVVLGLSMLSQVDERYLLRALGVVIVLYGLYGLAGANHAPIPHPRWRSTLAATTGVAGGSLGALFGAGVGPIYAVYMRALELDKDVFRVSMTSVIFFQVVARVCGFASLGFYEGAVLWALAAGIPFMLLGSWLGNAVVKRLDQNRFAQIVSGVLLLSGSALVLR